MTILSIKGVANHIDRADGPRAPLLFAVPPGKVARTELAAQLRGRRSALLSLSVIAVLAAASALAFAEPLIGR